MHFVSCHLQFITYFFKSWLVSLQQGPGKKKKNTDHFTNECFINSGNETRKVKKKYTLGEGQNVF